MTDQDVVVNDVFVDPKDSSRVLLATDRGGVLASQDGGRRCRVQSGLSERKVGNSGGPGRSFAAVRGVVNDKKFGGVFRSIDGGANWTQVARAGWRDVFALAQTRDGTCAGTSHGILSWTRQAGRSGLIGIRADLTGREEHHRQHGGEDGGRNPPRHPGQRGEAGKAPVIQLESG